MDLEQKTDSVDQQASQQVEGQELVDRLTDHQSNDQGKVTVSVDRWTEASKAMDEVKLLKEQLEKSAGQAEAIEKAKDAMFAAFDPDLDPAGRLEKVLEARRVAGIEGEDEAKIEAETRAFLGLAGDEAAATAETGEGLESEGTEDNGMIQDLKKQLDEVRAQLKEINDSSEGQRNMGSDLWQERIAEKAANLLQADPTFKEQLDSWEAAGIEEEERNKLVDYRSRILGQALLDNLRDKQKNERTTARFSWLDEVGESALTELNEKLAQLGVRPVISGRQGSVGPDPLEGRYSNRTQEVGSWDPQKESRTAFRERARASISPDLAERARKYIQQNKAG